MSARSRIPEILTQYDQALLKDWMDKQLSSPTMRADRIKEAELREQSQQFLQAVRHAVQQGPFEISSPPWEDVRALLDSISRSRALQGFLASC